MELLLWPQGLNLKQSHNMSCIFPGGWMAGIQILLQAEVYCTVWGLCSGALVTGRLEIIHFEYFLWGRGCVFWTLIWIWLKFSDVCLAVPTRWAVETAWTPRRERSLSWATAERERGSALAGERERLSVSIISQEQTDPKNAIILSFWSYNISVTLTRHLTVFKTNETDYRHVWRKALRDKMVCIEPQLCEARNRYPHSQHSKESNNFTECQHIWSSLSFRMIVLLLFPVWLRFMVRGYFPLSSQTPIMFTNYTLSKNSSVVWNITGKASALIDACHKLST